MAVEQGRPDALTELYKSFKSCGTQLKYMGFRAECACQLVLVTIYAIQKKIISA